MIADFRRRFHETAKRQVANEVSLDPGHSSDDPAGALVAEAPSPGEEVVAAEQADAVRRAAAAFAKAAWHAEEAAFLVPEDLPLDAGRPTARQMLADAYAFFTEGFDTPDLKAAKALLHDLDSGDILIR